MRFQKQFLVLGLVLLISAAVMLAGCGSDDNETKTIAGSLSDPNFVAVQSQVDAFIDSTVSNLKNSFWSLQTVAIDNDITNNRYTFNIPINPLTDIVTSSYTSGWHIIYINQPRETFGIVVTDKFRFFENDAIVEFGANSDSLYYVHNWIYTVGDTSVSHNTFVGFSNYICEDLTTVTATVNGTQNLSLNIKNVGESSTTWRNFEITAELNNIKVNRSGQGWGDNGCPVSGTISGTVEMTFQDGESTPVTTVWTVNVSFNQGTMSATISHGDILWSYSNDLCSPPN